MKSHWLAGLATVATSVLVAWGVQARMASSSRTAGDGRAILYYQDPMHPAYRSAVPGTAPDCGMVLVPVFADADRGPSHRPSAPAVVRVEPSRLPTLGVTLERLERSRVRQSVRGAGRVAPDENRLFVVTAGGDGWVTGTFAGTATGDVVRRGQPLAAVYGREFTTAERAFLFALRAHENPPPRAPGDEPDATAVALEEARLSLRGMGLGDAQLARLAESRRVLAEVTLTAPADGVIVARTALPNARFDRGTELFRIAGLDRVWIVADLFVEDAALLTAGTTAVVTLGERPGVSMTAAVAPALPRFDPASRTVQVRLAAANPGRLLTPGRIVDLEFAATRPAAVTVPDSAVLADGETARVFVARGEGRFEPRTVGTGWRGAGRIEITSGLMAGETVVATGVFLLDAEFRLQSRP
jgi:membrane fusion protein, copper/silver efflux system